MCRIAPPKKIGKALRICKLTPENLIFFCHFWGRKYTIQYEFFDDFLDSIIGYFGDENQKKTRIYYGLFGRKGGVMGWGF